MSIDTNTRVHSVMSLAQETVDAMIDVGLVGSAENITAFEDSVDELRDHVTEQFNEMDAEISRLTAELSSTQQQLGECSGGYETLEREVTALQGEIEDLKATLRAIVNDQSIMPDGNPNTRDLAMWHWTTVQRLKKIAQEALDKHMPGVLYY